MTKIKKIDKVGAMMMKNLCPFFGKCGGCRYQDLSAVLYLDKKQSFIKRAFADYGIEISPEAVREVPIGTRRRVSFAYANGRMGYNAYRSHDIVEITECRLLKNEIVDFLPVLRTWVQQLGGKGDIVLLSTAYGLDIHIKTTQGKRPDLRLLEQLAEMAGHPSVVRLIYNSEPIVEKVHLPFLPDDFLQPSAEGEGILVDLMSRSIGSAQKAVDLFCGNGTFTRPLLERGLSVKGYDCADNVRYLGENGIQRDLFRSPLLPEEFKGIDLIVLDPPRAGAKAQVEQIAQTNVPKIIMISCDPKTAARDCRILIQAGWMLGTVTPVDQFKWSDHIEIVCVLEK